MQRWTLDTGLYEMVRIVGTVSIDGSDYYVTYRDKDGPIYDSATATLLLADNCTVYVIETDIPPQSAPVPEATTYAIPGGVPYPPAKPDTSSVPPPGQYTSPPDDKDDEIPF